MSKKLDTLKVRIDGQVFEINPKDFLDIDYTRIKDHLLKYPSDFAWAGAIREAVTKQVSDAEYELEVTYAVLDSEYRKNVTGGTNEVNRKVKNSILQDKRYEEARVAVNELKYLEGQIKALVAPLTKMDSVLIQLSTLYKNENK